LIAKYLFTGSLKNRSIDNLETQKKYISMKIPNSLIIYSMQNRNKLEIKLIVDRFLFTNMKTRRLQHSTTAHE
jgi:hypothetical protein